MFVGRGEAPPRELGDGRDGHVRDVLVNEGVEVGALLVSCRGKREELVSWSIEAGRGRSW